MRLQRTYFSSQDQLLTLALGAVLDANVFTYAREVGVRCVSHGVSNNTERTLLELGRAGLLRPGDEYIHCTHLSDTAWRLIKDTGGRISHRRSDRDGDGPRHAADPGRARPRHPSEPELRRRRHHGAGSVHHHARGLHAAATAAAATRAQRRAEPAAAADLPRRARIRHHRGRPLRRPRQQGRHAHARQGGRHRHAARPTGSTSGRSTTRPARSSIS